MKAIIVKESEIFPGNTLLGETITEVSGPFVATNAHHCTRVYCMSVAENKPGMVLLRDSGLDWSDAEDTHENV